VYAAFRTTPSHQQIPRLQLLVPLVLVVALQVALLAYVTTVWTAAEEFKDNLSTNMASFFITSLGSRLPQLTNELANSCLLLMLTKMVSLCALALYTHAEVEAAVNLFNDLRDDMQQAPDRRPSLSALVVPLVQLAVAAYTLFVQGVLFQEYRVHLGNGDGLHTDLLEIVLASVGFAFILELDARAWTAVQPLLEYAFNGVGRQATNIVADAGGWLSQAWVRDASCMHLPQACNCSCMYWCCLSACGKCCTCCRGFLVFMFYLLLCGCECIFGMLLVLYATDPVLSTSHTYSSQLAGSMVLGCLGFLAMQAVAGVQSKPLSNRCAGAGPWRWRFVCLNIIFPLIVGAVARWAFSNPLAKQTAETIVNLTICKLALQSWGCHRMHRMQ
jgi:uncharacterized membrane protein YjjB (DUF3815 family)